MAEYESKYKQVFEKGSKCNVFNDAQFTGPVTINAGKNFDNPDPDDNPDADSEIILELKNCFYGDEAEAKSFLSAIKGMKDVAITELVRQKVKGKVIPVEAAGRRLWTILSKNGLYKASESNWRKNNK